MLSDSVKDKAREISLNWFYLLWTILYKLNSGKQFWYSMKYEKLELVYEEQQMQIWLFTGLFEKTNSAKLQGTLSTDLYTLF